MSKPSTTPRIDLANELSDQTLRAVYNIAYEVGIEPDDVNDCRYLAWLIEVLKHIRDNPKNFPRGKYATLQTLSKLTAFAAEQVARIYYGNI